MKVTISHVHEEDADTSRPLRVTNRERTSVTMRLLLS